MKKVVEVVSALILNILSEPEVIISVFHSSTPTVKQTVNKKNVLLVSCRIFEAPNYPG